MVTILRKNKVTQCEVYVRVNGETTAASLPAATPDQAGGGRQLSLLI